jgi:hypothetical protein
MEILMQDKTTEDSTLFSNRNMKIWVFILMLLFACGAIVSSVYKKDITAKDGEKLTLDIKKLVSESGTKDLNIFISNGEVYYISKDGEYIFKGDMVKIQTGENLTSKSKQIISIINTYRNEYSSSKESSGANQYDKEINQISPQTDMANPADEVAVKAYNDAMMARMKQNNIAINENVDNDSSSTENGKKDHIDINQIEDLGTSLKYKGVEINKIGFDQGGKQLSKELRIEQVKKIYADIAEKGDKWSVVYPATTKEKMGVVVFSDPTCGFCKKLHNSIKELNSAGVTVRYLMYPRSLDLGSEDFAAQSVISTMKSAWCSKNPREAFSSIYAGASLPEQDCSISKEQGRSQFPVYEHFLLGKIFDLEATPLSFTSNGQEIYGFASTDKYLQSIGL